MSSLAFGNELEVIRHDSTFYAISKTNIPRGHRRLRGNHSEGRTLTSLDAGGETRGRDYRLPFASMRNAQRRLVSFDLRLQLEEIAVAFTAPSVRASVAESLGCASPNRSGAEQSAIRTHYGQD